MIKKIKNRYITIIITLIIIFPYITTGKEILDELSDAKKTSGLAEIALETAIGKIIGGISGFIGSIFFLLIIIGGFNWMTAAGNEEKISKAKKLISGAMIGLLIVALAYVITSFIIYTLQKAGL